jgi:hypothetical protein
MFGILYKSKLEIEAKVNNLQKVYVQLLKAPIQGIHFHEQNNIERAREIVKEKLQNLEKIKAEYIAALKQFEQVSKDIIEAKESTAELEDLLDSLFDTLNLEIPEELKKEQSAPAITVTSPGPTEAQIEAAEEDKENSVSYQDSSREQEEEENEDKENSSNYQNGQPLSDSDEYFSPKILIRKTIDSSNTDCYTPAIKSSSRLPIFRR